LFGSQRFGGNNVAVGKAIKNGDLKQAVVLILEKIQPWLCEDGIEAVPKVFWYEKRMVRHLRKYPNDYAGTLRKIPKKVRKIFVHAVQSNQFNEQLKQAIGNKDIPKTMTIPGFQISKMPELSTTPITRRTLLTSPDFQILEIQDGITTIRFSLGKGEYASTVLLHLMGDPQI
jgi:tRNA(Glu) U13 pseudouridine synthase TruD